MTSLKTSFIVAVAAVVAVLIIGIMAVVALGKADSLGTLLIAIVPPISVLISIYSTHAASKTTQAVVTTGTDNIAQTINGSLESAVSNIMSTNGASTASAPCPSLEPAAIDKTSGVPTVAYPVGASLEQVITQWQANQSTPTG